MGDRWLGEMMIMAIVTPLLAAPATLLLLALFRRSVVAGMHRTHASGGDGGGDWNASEPAPVGGAVRATAADARRASGHAIAVYLVAGLVFALVFAAATLIQSQRITVLLVCFGVALAATPLPLVSWMVLPAGRARTAVLAGWATLVTVPLVMLCVKNPEVWRAILNIWVDNNVIATVLILAFMHQRIRAAGPLVLLLSAAAVLGANLLLDSLEFSAGMFVVALKLADVFGGVTSTYLLLALVGAAFGVAIAVPVLAAVGFAYSRKLIGDQMLTIDTVFLWFALAYAVWLAPDGAAWLWTGVVAFAGYRIVAGVGFWALGYASRPARTDVLLLRPFSLGVRSERLFDQLSKVWLRIGSVHMIAGPDLVRSTVSPPEFLAFLGRRLARRFIHDEQGLREHLAAIDLRPDPDGRYRVNQLFCGDDAWKQAMAALAALGTPILMDLRGFTRANQGCTYEIEHLVRSVSLDRVVFAVDSTTDRPYLDEVQERIWQCLPAGSPNLAYGGLAPRFVVVDASAAGRERLVRSLLECTA